MPYLQRDGLRLYWEACGEGPDVFLLHGFGETLETIWGQGGWLSALAGAGRRAVAMDLRGHGRSDKPLDPSVYVRERFADDLAALVEAAGNGERAAFVGFSMGAEVVLRYLLRHGERRASRAAFVSLGLPTLRPRRKRTALSIRALRSADVSGMHRGLQKLRRIHEDKGNDLETVATMLEAELDREPLEPEALEVLDLPTLFVSGGGDWVVGDAAPLAERIRGSRVERIPDADHDGAVFAPRTREKVLEFLNAGA